MKTTATAPAKATGTRAADLGPRARGTEHGSPTTAPKQVSVPTIGSPATPASLLQRLEPRQEKPDTDPGLGAAWVRATAGTPQDLPRRAEIENKMGRRVGPIQVFAGDGPRSLLDRLGARSAVRGRQILLRDRSVDAVTLTHEVAHVLQSGPDARPAESEVAPLAENDAAEREAEGFARQLWFGPAKLGTPGPPLALHQRVRPGRIALRRLNLPVDWSALTSLLPGDGTRTEGDARRPAPEPDTSADPAPVSDEAAPELDEDAVTDGDVDTDAPAPTTTREGRAAPMDTPVGRSARARRTDTDDRAARPERRGDEAEPADTTTAPAREGPTAASPLTAARPGCEINPRARLDEFMERVDSAWERGAQSVVDHEVRPCAHAAIGPGQHPFARGPPEDIPEIREAAPVELPAAGPVDEEALVRAREELGTLIADVPTADVDRSGIDPETDRLRDGQARGAQQEVSELVATERPSARAPPETAAIDSLLPSDDAGVVPAVVLTETRTHIADGRAQARSRVADEPFDAAALAPHNDPTAALDLGLDALDVPTLDLDARVDDGRRDRIPTADNAGTLPLDDIAVLREPDMVEAAARMEMTRAAEIQIDTEISSSETALSAACSEAGGTRAALESEGDAGVAGRQQDWIAEIDDLSARRTAEAEALTRERTAHVDDLRATADERSTATMEAARAEANRRWDAVSERAEAQANRASARNLWEQAIEFARAGIARILDAVRSFVAACRRAVDALLDAAAAVAHGIVEAARQAITRTLDLLRAGLNLIADNLPGEWGRIARAARDAINVFLDDLQARLDAWATSLHETIDAGIAALRDRLHQALDALAAGLEAIAAGIDALLTGGLMAFLRANFPLLAALLDEGLIGPIDRAGLALGTWIEGLLRQSGLLEMQEALLDIERSGLCEPMTPAEQADLCQAFEQLLQQLLGELDELLASPVASDFQESLEQSRDQGLDDQVGAIESIYTFAQEAATDILAWWDRIESAIDGLYEYFGAYACAIWRHIAAFLDLPINLEPITALRQKLEELWTRAVALVQPIIDVLMDLWRWWNESSFLEPLYQLWAWLGRAWDMVGNLWDWMLAEGDAWLAGLAESAEQNIVEPLRQLLATVNGLLLSVVDQLANLAQGLLARLDAFIASLLDIPLLGAVVRLLRALTAPLRTLIVLAFQCFIVSLRMQIEVVFNLGHYLRVLGDVIVGLVIAFSAPPLTIAAFLIGNVWLRLVPDCYKLAIINFLLDVVIRVIEFVPAPADIGLFIMYEGARRFLHVLRDDQTDRKVRAIDMVARIFAGDVEMAAGFVLGLLEALWDSTIGLVILLLRIVWWLVQLPFQLMGMVGGGDDDGDDGTDADTVTAGSETAGADAAAAAQAELAAQEAQDAADGGVTFGVAEDDPASAEDEEDLSASESAGPASDTGGWDPTRPPEAPAELQRVRTVLEDFVSERLTRADLERALNEFREQLRASIDPLAEQAADTMLTALSGEGITFAVGRAMGYVVGIVVILVLLAVFTGPGVAAAGPAELSAAAASTAGRAGASGMRAVAQVLPRIRSFLQPLLEGFARFVGPRLQALLARVWPWIQNLTRWLRVVAGRARALWRSLPPWLRDLLSAWAGWKVRAAVAAEGAWSELRLDMSDEVVSHNDLRVRLMLLRAQFMRTLPRGLSLRFRAEYEDDADEWRLRARVRRAMFSGGGTVVSRFAYASWRAGPGYLATDQQGDPWFSTAGEQSDRQRRVVELVDRILEEIASTENEPGTDLRTIYDRLQDNLDPTADQQERADPGLLEHVNLIFQQTFQSGTDDAGLPALILNYIISPNTSHGQIPVSVPGASTGGTDAPLPETHVEYGDVTTPAEFGTSMVARPLTNVGPEGSAPRVSSTWWEELNLRRSPTESMGSYYIRGHLLNHNIHGPGNTWENLSPITRSANGTHEDQVESTLKTAVDSGDILEYRVRVEYPAGGPNTTLLQRIAEDTSVDQDIRDARRRIVVAEQYLPTAFVCSAWHINRTLSRLGDPIFDAHPIPNRPTQQSPGDYVVAGAAPRRLVRLNLRNPLPETLPPANSADPQHRSLALDAYQKLPGVGPARAVWLLDHRDSFNAWSDVYREGSGLSRETVEAWQDQTFVVRLRGDPTAWDPSF